LPLPLVERPLKQITRIIKRRVEAIRDVKSCHKLSVHMTRKRSDVSLHVSLDSRLNFEEVHKIASKVEREVTKVLPNARVTVQTNPLGHAREDIRTLAKEIADRLPGSMGVHNVHIQKIDGKPCVDLHVEVSADMDMKQAHEISDKIERGLRAANPSISEITIHMESASDRMSKELNEGDTELVWYIKHVAKHYNEIRNVSGIKIRRVASGRHVVFRCRFDPNMRMKEAYEITTGLQNAIKSAYPDIERIDIQEEAAPTASEHITHSRH